MTRDRRARDWPSHSPAGHAGTSDYDQPDQYAGAGNGYAPGWDQQDEYAPADGHAAANDYAESDGYLQSGPNSYPSNGYSASASDVRDAYARDAFAQASRQAAPGYAPDEGYGSPDDGYQDVYAPADGYAPAGRYDEASAQYDHGYAGQDRDDPYPDHDPAGYQGQDGYSDSGPFRWQPEGNGEPEDPGEEPQGHGYARGGDREARSRGRDDRGLLDWDDEPSRDGFIPGMSGRGSGRGGRRRRVGRVLAPVLALVLLVVVGAGGYEAYKRIDLHSADYTGPGFGSVTVEVMPGDTATSLAPRLVKAGVVASVSSFIAAAKASSNSAGLEPGFFTMHHHMNSALAYKLLLNPAARQQTVVTIPEGLRMTQILALLQQKLGKIMGPNAFANAIKDTAALGLPSYADGNPEGYLFPATYDIQPGTSALGVLQMMVARFNQEAQAINLPAAAAAGQITPAHAIIVASILEAEGTPQYYSEIAEVIYNRLNQNIDLGLDSTVNYALNRTGPNLTQAQLATNSPYNTFIHPGLPPGPIDSPGEAAIQAALHPMHGDELYFVTVNLQTGQTLFTNNQQQFDQDVALCQQNHAGC